MATALGDVLGPRAKRRVAVASVIAGVLLAWLAFVAYSRLEANGQLTRERWEPFTQIAVVRFFLLGLVATMKVALTAMVFACILGTLLALGRLARNPVVRLVAGGYVEFFRAVPLLLLILFTAIVLPRYNLDFSVFTYLVLALVAYNAAVLGEIFRAGILSLDRGQGEAASSIGMTYWQSMLLVIVPQAYRRMVPAIVSQLITLLKDTSLGFVITYDELLRRARSNGEFFRNPLQSYAVAAFFYIVVNFALSRVAQRLEVRQQRRFGGGPVAVAGGEDLAVVQAQGGATARP